MITTDIPADRKMADTRNMAVVHSAMRRDLVRIGLLLTDTAADSPTTRQRLGAHLRWFLDFLDHHHDAEDAWLWPVLGARGQAGARLADAMAGEHRAIDPSVAALRTAASAYAAGRTTRSELHGAILAVQGVLAPHLAHEEGEAMTLAARLITRKEWMQFEKEGALKGRSIRELGWDANWILDGTTDEQREQFLQGVPRLVRMLVFDRFTKVYRADRDALWGRTAAEVPSLTAADLAARAS